jgi:ABC-type nitrate/sulfonate/bicarbonate transport system substrate-binding protein
MKKRYLVAAAAAVLMLSSCAESGGTSTTSSSSAVPLTPIIIGVSSDPTSLSLIVAEQEGFFQKHGLEVKNQLFSSAGDALTAAVAGDVQLAGTVSDLTILGTKAKGADVQVVAVLDSTDRQVGLVGDSSIKSSKDLNGKTVGMTAGVAAQFYQVQYFSHYKLDASKIKVVNIAPADTVAALAAGTVDAFFGFEPWLTKASSAVPGAHVVNYSGDDGVYPLQLALAGTSQWISAHEALTTDAIEASADAATWIKSHKSAAIALAMTTYHLDKPTATTLVDNQGYVANSPSVLKAKYTEGAEFLNDQKVVTIPDASKLVSSILNSKPFSKIK